MVTIYLKSGEINKYKDNFLIKDKNLIIINLLKYFKKNNKVIHREDGPAVIYSDGSEEWWKMGKLHRLDGPAVIYSDGSEEWWVNGMPHHLNGPAVIKADETKEWWINGKQLPTKRVEKWLEANKIDLTTEEGQTAFKIKWG